MLSFICVSLAYATGLLVARRALTKLGLADKYEGVTEPDGTISTTAALDDEDAPRPFKCYLDVGLRRTLTGSRHFGAMKGASDGGLYIPHSDKRFPGYDPETKQLDSEVLKKYIFGGHVAEYMESLEEEDDERYIFSFVYSCFFCIRIQFYLLPNSGLKNNFQRTSLMVLVLKTLKRFTKMHTPPFVKIPPSNRLRRRRTGRPKV